MAGSASEREIRDYAAQRLRDMRPGARIIHELVIGRCRADLAAVEREHICVVEIKSEKDTLTRLETQVRTFVKATHEVIIIAHERWFDTTPYDNGRDRFVPSEDLQCPDHPEIWAYPEQQRANEGYSVWKPNPWQRREHQPRAATMLGMLWGDELRAECFRHQIAASSRTNKHDMVRDMCWLMTGKEIAQAVCRQLRLRPFPEADAPIVEKKA